MELIDKKIEDSVLENIANFPHEMISFETGSIEDFIRNLTDVPIHRSASLVGRITRDLKL